MTGIGKELDWEEFGKVMEKYALIGDGKSRRFHRPVDVQASKEYANLMEHSNTEKSNP